MVVVVVDRGGYMKFVADAPDIVRGANICMWSNFVPHKNLCKLCGDKLLCMNFFLLYINFFACGAKVPQVTSNFVPLCIIMIYVVSTFTLFLKILDCNAVERK